MAQYKYSDVVKQQEAMAFARLHEEHAARIRDERRNPPASIFISYTHSDRAVTVGFCKRLLEIGIGYYLDEKEVDPGDDIPDNVAAGIRSSTHYLLLLSAKSLASDWVRAEAAFAAGTGKDALIVMLEPGLSPPGPLSPRKHFSDMDEVVDFFRELPRRKEESLHLLLNDIFHGWGLRHLPKYEPENGLVDTWLHRDLQRWAEDEGRNALSHQFIDDAPRPSAKLGRIAIKGTAESPVLVLSRWTTRDEEMEDFRIACTDGELLLRDLQNPHHTVSIDVHPTFWRDAIALLRKYLECDAPPPNIDTITFTWPL